MATAAATAAARSLSLRKLCGRYYLNSSRLQVLVTSCTTTTQTNNPFLSAVAATSSRYASTNNQNPNNSSYQESNTTTIMTATIIVDDNRHHDDDKHHDENDFPSQAMLFKQRDENLTPLELQAKMALLQYHQSLQVAQIQRETTEKDDATTSRIQQQSLEHLRTCFESMGFWQDALLAEKLLEPYYNNDDNDNDVRPSSSSSSSSSSSLSSLARCIYRQGKLYMLMSDPLQASVQYQKALELFQMELFSITGSLYHADIGNVLLAKAGLEFQRQQIDKSLQLLQESELHFRCHHHRDQKPPPQQQQQQQEQHQVSNNTNNHDNDKDNHGNGASAVTTAPHPDLVKCLDHQAMMYRLKGDYPTSLAKYQEALQLLQVLIENNNDHNNGMHDTDHTDHTELHDKRQSLQLHIADVLGTMDDVEGALAMYQTILDQDRHRNNNKTDATAADPALEGVILHSMGCLHMQQRKLELAEQELTRAVMLKQRSAGEAHPEVAKSFVALGSVLGVLGKKRQALECFQQALLIERANSEDPDNDPEILQILRNMAILKGEKVAKW
jgi:tetratricopeptide (TPR) repeat protein